MAKQPEVTSGSHAPDEATMPSPSQEIFSEYNCAPNSPTHDSAQDDIVAALNALTPADMHMDLMLDHLTTSNDLFASPHLDLSALSAYGDDHQGS
jgi:hypothetical protein